MADIDVEPYLNELKRLVEDERQALADNSFRELIIRFYDTAGGSRVRVRQAAVLVALIRAANKLNKADLPGPDNVWRPIIMDAVQQIVGETVDDFFAGKGLVQCLST